MLKPNLFVFLIIVGLLINSCHKNREDDPITPIDGSMREMMFNKGSYWIYLDSSTGILDSTYIESTLLKNQFKGSSHDHATFQMFTMNYRNFLEKETSKVDIVTNQMVYDFTQLDFSRLIWRPLAISSDLTYYHFRPKGKLDSINVLGEKYKDVFVVENDSLLDIKTGTFKRIYLKNNIGIVKQEWFRNNQLIKTKNLLRFNVELFKLP